MSDSMTEACAELIFNLSVKSCFPSFCYNYIYKLPYKLRGAGQIYHSASVCSAAYSIAPGGASFDQYSLGGSDSAEIILIGKLALKRDESRYAAFFYVVGYLIRHGGGGSTRAR